MTPVGKRMVRRRALLTTAALSAALAAVALAGCTSVRNDLGTSNSGCFVALPAAADAVNHQGHLHGVRLVNVSSLRTSEGRLYRAATSTPGSPIERVCLVAFTGHFEASQVSKPIGRTAGRLAVVELEYPDNRLVATLLIARPPLPFGHPHLGLL